MNASPFNNVSPAVIDALRTALGADAVHTDSEALSLAASDETEDLAFSPEVVVTPADAGGVAAVMNARHATAKEKGWAEKPPPPSEFARAVAKEPNLLRRPIVVAGNQVIVGFNKTAYAKLG